MNRTTVFSSKSKTILPLHPQVLGQVSPSTPLLTPQDQSSKEVIENEMKKYSTKEFQTHKLSIFKHACNHLVACFLVTEELFRTTQKTDQSMISKHLYCSES